MNNVQEKHIQMGAEYGIVVYSRIRYRNMSISAFCSENLRDKLLERGGNG
jgi:hypothetical protein